MIVPSGVTVVFDGGSFTGALPSSCEFKNSPVVVGTGSGVALTFQSGASLASGSSLALNGGSVAIDSATIAGTLTLTYVSLTITTSLTVSGSLTSTGNGSISAPTLATSGGGTITLNCGAASGTTWNVTTLEAASIEIASLTSSGDVDSAGDATGTTWNVGGILSVGGDCDVGTLTAGTTNIIGNAEGTTWTTGALSVGGSFDVPTLTLNGASGVSLANVENLTLGASAVLTISANSTIINLTTTSGSSIVFSQSFLAVEESASFVSQTSVAGVGYLAVPSSAALAGLTYQPGADVRVCEYGAGVTRIDSVVGLDNTTITSTPTKTDSSKSVLAEVKVGDVWTLINARASGAITTTVQGRETRIRTFDGVSFFETSVYSEPPHAWLVYVNAAAVQAVNPWRVTTDYIMASEYNYAGESILLFARIENSGSSAALTSSDVASIKYTCYKRSFTWGKETRTAVAGHSNVTVPLNAIQAALVTNDSRWTKDSTGYNFRYEPDTTTNPIFPSAGEYVIVVTIAPTSGNPAPICYEVSVR